METREKNRWAVAVFAFLMREAVDAAFRFPGGGAAQRTVGACMQRLDEGSGKLSREKVVDFCICQVYAITFYDREYLRRWKPSHSFGPKALERFTGNTRARRYYEDIWLRGHGLSREGLIDMIRDRSRHPLSKFIYPEYEDATKARKAGTEAGLYVCSVSTLMWTPFSPVCSACSMAFTCQHMTQERYPELSRIREEEHRKGGKR